MEVNNSNGQYLSLLKRELVDLIGPMASFVFIILMVFGLNWLGARLVYWMNGDYQAIVWAIRIADYALAATATLILLTSLMRQVRKMFRSTAESSPK